MARIRSIKPEFWRSTTIARLSHRERLTFIALWSYVDDNGVGRDIPQIFAGECFALEPDPREALANVQRDLARLSEEGRITRYTVAGKPYLHITNWHEHQRIDKPNKPRYPGPDDPGAALTCDYGESREDAATPARESREGYEQVPLLEQGNRGAGEQGIPPEAAPGATLALVPQEATAATVVSAYVDACRESGQVLDNRAKGRIGKEAAQLLKDGAPHSLLVAAAQRLAVNGYADIGAEARRLRGESTPKPSTTDARVAETRARAAALRAAKDVS